MINFSYFPTFIEKELHRNLDDINHEIHSLQQHYDSVAWPEHNDIKLMKNMVGKANSNVSNMEKEKRIQDAYIDRLRKDIEMSENELEQLAITAKGLKEWVFILNNSTNFDL